jgi:acyl CoA:acetate/3-ketoacid CoA transferase alpha subunit
MNKVVANADDAIRDVFDGATLMVGGFGLCGIPENLIRALVRKGTKNLKTISNNVGVDGLGMGLLLAAGQIVSHIGTYVGENKLLEQMVLEKKIHLDLIPQGTFSERIRAGGAGIPAFSRRPVSAQLSLRIKKPASSTAVPTSWNMLLKRTSPSSKHGRATGWEILSTAKRRATLIP